MTQGPFTIAAESSLSLREKIAQLIFVRIGSNLSPVRRVEDDVERIEELLGVCPVGGLLLFNGGLHTKAALERLQAKSRFPLLVGSDIERGVGQQVQGYTLFPHAMALGRHDQSITTFIEATSREAREVGIHITFAPVTDVATNPLNPIISIRAFSEDAERASQLSAQYVEQAEASGLLTTAKHYPGHGDTRQDSHDSLPSVVKSLEDLRHCELRPFQAAIDAGCSLVMTAHVAFPQIDPSGTPATLSPILLKQVLRDEMGFTGAVCSDSLLMAGVRDLFPNEGEMALATLNAGVDMLLDLRDPVEVVDYLASCVERGTLDAGRVDEAYGRIRALKQKAFGELPNNESPANSAAMATGTDTSFVRHAERVAKDAVDVLNNSGRAPLPFKPETPLGAILLRPFETAIDPPVQPFAAVLRERFRNVTYIQLGPNADPSAYKAADALAKGAEQLVIAMIIRPAAWHAFGLRPEQSEFVRHWTTEREDVVLTSLGVPYALQDYPNAAVEVCTFSDVPASQQAMADWLLTSD